MEQLIADIFIGFFVYGIIIPVTIWILFDHCFGDYQEKVVVEIGKGVSYEVDEEGILIIKIDTKVDFGLSSTGKSTIIASSSGNKQIDLGSETAFLGLNLYKKQ